MENANNTHSVKVEKTIALVPADVFRAISEGRLFMNCGADQGSMKIDFKVGGKYVIDFRSYGKKNNGEFLEIIENKKIVFTWCQDPEVNSTPDTKVVIELRDVSVKTSLTLTHSGFTDQELADAHNGGWNSGLDDLTQEMANGKIRMIRKLQIPLEKLYEICKNALSFEHDGKFSETIPNEKLIFNAQNTKVSLIFEADDEPNTSWITLVHEGLKSEAEQKNQRTKWESLLKNLK